MAQELKFASWCPWCNTRMEFGFLGEALSPYACRQRECGARLWITYSDDPEDGHPRLRDALMAGLRDEDRPPPALQEQMIVRRSGRLELIKGDSDSKRLPWRAVWAQRMGEWYHGRLIRSTSQRAGEGWVPRAEVLRFLAGAVESRLLTWADERTLPTQEAADAVAFQKARRWADENA